MKVHIRLVMLLLLKASCLDAQDIFTPSIQPNTAFIAGENVTYQIRYGFIIGGIAIFTLTEELYEGKPVFHARAFGETSGLANALFGVRDIYESWFDKESNFPYKQIRNIKEGHYRRYNEVTCNREENTVHSKVSGVHSVPDKILDITSIFYYLRRINFSQLKVGDVIFVNLYFADEIFPFRLRYSGKEIIKSKFGKISCLKICPVVEVGRLFKGQDDLAIWFSDDASRLPVLVMMEIRFVGTVLLKLIKYENTANQMVFLKE
jgi:hypothetical protein